MSRALHAYHHDQALGADLRQGLPMPMEWLPMVLAERWHVPPWVVAEQPADQLFGYVALLAPEGRANREREGLGPSDTVACECYGDDADD